MPVTAGPSGGEKGEVGVGKFRIKFETTTAGLLVSTVLVREDSVVLSLVGGTLISYQ